MTCFIAYVATNVANGKRYVGISTTSLSHRRRCHIAAAAKGSKVPLHRAIWKYGVRNFIWAVVYEAVDWRELQAVERALIAQYGTYAGGGRGYNATLGGEGGYGRVVTEEQRRQSSLSRKGRKLTPEECAAVSAGLKKFHAENPLASLANGNGIRGKRRSAADKEKKAEAGRKYWQTPEGIARRGAQVIYLERWRHGNPELRVKKQAEASAIGAAKTRGVKQTPEFVERRMAAVRAALRLKKGSK